MKKKLGLLFVSLMLTLTASAQFEEEKVYVAGSLSGLDINYNGNNKFSFGVQAKAGYFFEDDWMVLGQFAYNHYGNETVPDYIEQNGLFVGANASLVHTYHNYNDIMPGFELGYAFFVSRTVTIEPSLYYNQSFKSHSKYSTVGLRIGVGIYI